MLSTSTSFAPELWAKSDGETLDAHTRAVIEAAKRLIERLPARLRDGEHIGADLVAAAALHDIGKAATGFQRMLHRTQDNWNGRRHEILSTAFAAQNESIRDEVLFAVLTHHRPIEASSGQLDLSCDGVPPNWTDMVEEWRENEALVTRIWERLCVEMGRPDLVTGPPFDMNGLRLDRWLEAKQTYGQVKDVPFERRHYASLLRGLLVSADHMASGGKAAVIPDVVPLQSWSPGFELREFQTSIGETAGHAILRAPTGSGKTEASLNWARHNARPNSRLFYVLPFRAAINAMHGRLQEEYPANKDGVGLLHAKAAHHLYFSRVEDQVAGHEAQAEARAQATLAREMFHSVRVTTPHQLLRSALHGRGWEQMLAEFADACVVFDEVHAYEPALAGLTLGSAKLFASEFGAKLLFLSATLPRFLREEIEKLVPCRFLEPDATQKRDREVLQRTRHELSIRTGTVLDCLPEIADAANSGEHVLVVCNHVPTAQQLWEGLRKHKDLVGLKEEVVLFHSRFNGKDRRDREKALASRDLPRILVATQVVEVSLDVSFDRGYSEPAPIDALTQRFGRVNRKGNTPKPVVLCEQSVYPRPLYDEALVKRTIECLRRCLQQSGSALSEESLVAVGDEVYANGYSETGRSEFEEKVNHRFFTHFREVLVAGRDEDWANDLGLTETVEVLPEELVEEYGRLRKQKLSIEADSLLVGVRTGQAERHGTRRLGDVQVVGGKYCPKRGLTWG